jgi:predicted nucleic acid binding AN1-type Zn finger protein
VDFDFDRKLSWKAWGHRYHRTANFEVYMDFLMDVANPQKSSADLGARIHVADGKGTFDCKITGQPSDSCNFSLTVKSPFIGSVGFSESW